MLKTESRVLSYLHPSFTAVQSTSAAKGQQAASYKETTESHIGWSETGFGMLTVGRPYDPSSIFGSNSVCTERAATEAGSVNANMKS